MKLFNILLIGVFLLFVATRCLTFETESAEAFDETVAAEPEPEPVAPPHTESTATSHENTESVFTGTLRRTKKTFNKGIAIIGENISWLGSIPHSIRHDKIYELIQVVKQQHIIVLLSLLALPFLVFSVTRRTQSGEAMENVVQNSKFTPKLSEAEYQQQTKDFTEAELAKLETYIKQNPNVIESTEHYKKSIASESS